MKGDDEEDDQNVSIGVARYPCMPSLVALQQMRNRLHLAHLGKKLMKWTAMATGREQRKIATEIHEVYDDFPKDIRNAFILLARCRYFCPNLNNIVTEGVGNKASILMSATMKSVAGVRVSLYQLDETGVEPYPHLGIEKGGQLLSKTKKAWRDMLKRMILMLQLRNSFEMLDLANKAATKKMNVLSRIVVPRINLSINYILSELEEASREEFFRLKRVKQNKQAKNKQKNDSKLAPIPEVAVVPESKAVHDSEVKGHDYPECKQDSHKAITFSDKREVESQQDSKTTNIKQDKTIKLEDKLNSKSITPVITPPTFTKTPSTKSCPLPTESKTISKEVKHKSESALNINDDVKELGYFENKFKEIIKITRLQNPDGTITEEKQVITIRTERKNPRVPREICIGSYIASDGESCHSIRKKIKGSRGNSKTSMRSRSSTQSCCVKSTRSTQTCSKVLSENSKSAQTSCKEIPITLQGEDKSKQCVRNQTVTEPLNRDNFTSTTGVDTTHSDKSLKLSHNSSAESKEKAAETGSCCVIKIITKPSTHHPSCTSCLTDDDRLTKALVEALKKVFSSQNKGKDSKSNFLCEKCITQFKKLTSDICSTHTTLNDHPSCKNLKRTLSNQSAGYNCKGQHSKGPSTQTTSCISGYSSKSFSDIIRNRFGSSADNSLESASMKSVCCETKKSGKNYEGKAVHGLAKSSKCSKNCIKFDASTCTKNSDRFDVRSGVRRARQNSKGHGKDCCYSDFKLQDKSKQTKPVRNSKSLCEADCGYFRKR